MPDPVAASLRLAPEALTRPFSAEQFSFSTTNDLEPFRGVLGQERAVEALQFGVAMPRPGYNVFVMGEPGTGRFSFVKRYLKAEGKRLQTPADWVYVNNFDEPREPRALELPGGAAAAFIADINALVDNGKLVPDNWVTRLPNNSAPFTSATVFIVRKGNPKALKDWPDLLKDGVQVIVPNPKTSGNGRYTYLSAWGYVLKNGGDEDKAKTFVGKLFKQAPVLDTGGRAATTTFMTNQIGDVLVTFENEAEMIAREFGRDQFEVVYPSVSAEAEPPVSVVDKVVEKKGTRAVAEDYLKYLWSPEGQEIAANNYLRPRDPKVLAKYTDRFPKVDFLSVEKTFGDWRTVQKTHFNDGGVFDQIYSGQ